ncbi:MAG: hypothetical protein JO316_05485 [Abitibacteriaceae bacterium]|nr:hypothetical protein [Abditibacteriaceae bacterium]
MKRNLVLCGLFFSLLMPVFMAVNARPAQARSWGDVPITAEKPKPTPKTPRPSPAPGPKDGDH